MAFFDTEKAALQHSLSQMQNAAKNWGKMYNAHVDKVVPEMLNHEEEVKKVHKQNTELTQANENLHAQIQQIQHNSDMMLQKIAENVEQHKSTEVQQLQEAYFQQIEQLKVVHHASQQAFTEKVEQLTAENAQLLQGHSAAQKTIVTIGANFQQLNSELAHAKETLNDLQAQKTALKDTVDQLEVTVTKQQKNMNALLQSIGAHDAERHTWEQKALDLGNEVADLKKENAIVVDKNNGLVKQVVNLEASQTTHAHDRVTLADKVSKLQTEKEEKENIITANLQRIYELETSQIASKKKEPDVPPTLHPSEEEWISMFLQRPIAQEFVPIASLSMTSSPMSSPFAPLRRQPETTYWHHIY
jgi:chromosome segregation ATPase